MSTPAVCVLMPAYNAGRFIFAAVESILAQTLADFEFLIVDDGSTDDTGAIAERLAARDRRIRVLSRPNTGIIGALNDGLAAATAPLVARMDADDVALPQRLELQARFMGGHTGCNVVGAQALVMDAQGLPIGPFNVPLGHAEIEAALLGGSGPGMIHPAVMMRLDSLRRAGGYRSDARHVEDRDLFLRLAEVGQLANLPDVLLHYRVHLASVSASRRDEQNDMARRVIDEARARRGLPPRSGAQAPGSNAPPSTPVDERRRWIYRACAAGNYATARKHAWPNVRAAPLSRHVWGDLALALRLRPARKETDGTSRAPGAD